MSVGNDPDTSINSFTQFFVFADSKASPGPYTFSQTEYTPLSSKTTGPFTIRVLCSNNEHDCAATPNPSFTPVCLPTPDPGLMMETYVITGPYTKSRRPADLPPGFGGFPTPLPSDLHIQLVSPCGSVSPTPLPIPPAPISMFKGAVKNSYVASVLSKPDIPLTDSADTATFGTLTWNATTNQAPFTSPALAQSQTASAPYNDDFTFSIPQTTPANSYQLSFTVTSSKTGTTSQPLVVTMQLEPVQIFGAFADDAGTFQSDPGSNGFDGSIVGVAPAPSATPDFPFTASNEQPTSSTRRAPSAIAASKNIFDPTNPPSEVADALAISSLFSKIPGLNRLFGSAHCGVFNETDNVRHDRTSGTARGFQTAFAYCQKGINFTGASVEFKVQATSISSGASVGNPKTITVACQPTGQTYSDYNICQTPDLFMRTVSSHAELENEFISLNLPGAVTLQAQSLDWALNNKGVFYPTIPTNYAAGPALNTIAGIVSFPGNDNSGYNHWFDCTGEDASTKHPQYCFENHRRNLAKNLEDAGYLKPVSPPTIFEAHHVQPVSWGGINDYANGVWLPKQFHNQFTSWFLPVNFRFQ